MRGFEARGAWRSDRAGSRAFTLVELMVVVIILAVIAGVVLPEMGGTLGTSRLDTAARRVADLLDFCYTSAVSTGKVHGLVFDSDGRRFQVVIEAGTDDDPAALEPVTLPGMLNESLPEGVVLASASAFEEDLLHTDDDQTRILFFPNGTTEFANLTLSDAKDGMRLVKLNGLSGTVTIERPPPAGREDDQSDSGGGGEGGE